MKLSAKTTADIGGQSRTLVLNMNVMSLIEEALNVNLMQDGETFFASLNFTKMRTLIWAMLYKENPRPSVNTVGEWLSDIELDAIGDSIGKLFAMDNEKKPGKKKAGAASDPMKG